MITQDRETGWRASDTVPAASLPPPKAAAPGGGGGSTATAAAAPTSGSAREQVLEALADSRGMWVDTDAKTEVCARVDARRVLDCMHLSVRMRAAMHTCAYASRVRAASRWQVWQSLPSSLQQALASQKIALVELALKLLLDEVGEQELESLMQRCLEARFWDTPEDHSV